MRVAITQGNACITGHAVGKLLRREIALTSFGERVYLH